MMHGGRDRYSANRQIEPTIGSSSVVSIGSLLNRELGSWTNDWVHVNGLVAAYQPGQSLVVKDPTGVIRARIIQLTEIQGDERVDVWGFFSLGRQGASLDNAYFEVVRPIAQGNAPSVSETPSAGPQPPFLTEILDVAKLSRSDAVRHLSVRLRGVLTYADPEWRNGFLQDRSGAIYVDLDPSFKELRSGQFVEVIGRTSPGGFAPEVLSTSVTVQGTTNLPVPIPVDLEDLVNGQLDARWVEMEGVVRRVDAFQQRHRVTGFAFGVVKKFGDDRAGSLAALIAYYAFLAIFPLLLLLVTILGFVAQNNADFQHRLVDSALSEFPIIGNQIARNVKSLRASGLGLVISLVGLAWGSLGFTQAGQHAMAQVWNVPGVDRPGFLPRIGRGASIIGVLGLERSTQ